MSHEDHIVRALCTQEILLGKVFHWINIVCLENTAQTAGYLYFKRLEGYYWIYRGDKWFSVSLSVCKEVANFASRGNFLCIKLPSLVLWIFEESIVLLALCTGLVFTLTFTFNLQFMYIFPSCSLDQRIVLCTQGNVIVNKKKTTKPGSDTSSSGSSDDYKTNAYRHECEWLYFEGGYYWWKNSCYKKNLKV